MVAEFDEDKRISIDKYVSTSTAELLLLLLLLRGEFFCNLGLIVRGIC